MNPAQMLSKIEDAIKNRPASAAKKFALYEEGGQIKCEPVIANPPETTLIGTYTPDELTKGFTNSQWSKIMNKLAGILRKEGS